MATTEQPTRSRRRVAPHPTVEERTAAGRAARKAVPRSSHRDWAPAPDRRDPVDMLEEQGATRVPELVPVRYGRMLVSPFTFYRGAAYLMAADLDPTPRTGLDVQLCGDAHLSNFGAFAAPDRRLVFSINDFDETHPGPFDWDVKRLAASFAVAGRDRGFSERQRAAINREVGRSYREAMHDFAGMRTLDIWYARLDVDEIFDRFRADASRKEIARFEGNLAKTRSKDSIKAMAKLTAMSEDGLRIVGDPPLITPIEDLAGDGDSVAYAREIVRDYRSTLSTDHRRLIERFRYVHAARKVVGVGSVGTRAWIMLLVGRDGDDPLFLQFKEAQASVLEPFLGASRFANHGRRVVEGQRLTQSASDIMLGWIRATGLDGASRDFYVRQLWDAKGSALIDVMRAAMMERYAGVCGWTLARAHARSGDPIALAAYLGRSDTFDRAIADFAERYADQNERDYAAVEASVASGRLTAEAPA
jgi:uncharacterized protein (DUF2252 family)